MCSGYIPLSNADARAARFREDEAPHTFFFCILLRLVSWDLISSFRLSIGSVLALLWAAPLLAGLARRIRLWMTLIASLWVGLAPVALVGFFLALGGR